MGDVMGAQGAISSAAGEFGLAWLEAGREVRGPLASASAVAFEEVVPVRDFPSYRGSGISPILRGWRA